VRRKFRWKQKPDKDRSGEIHGIQKVVGFSHYQLRPKGGRVQIWQTQCLKCSQIRFMQPSNLRKTTSCLCQSEKRLALLHKGNVKDDIAFKYVLNDYKHSAKKRGIRFSLEESDFRRLTQQPCFYCGVAPSKVKDRNGSHVFKRSKFVYNGIDRVNNTKDYNFQNCVSCCRDCNIAKGTRTIEEFFAWIQRLTENNKSSI